MNNAEFNGTINPTTIANTLLAQGIPVIVGEVGDNSSNGTTSAPVITQITTWADQKGGSVVAWTWNVWNSSPGTPGPNDLLIKDATGTPTDGEGVTFKNWIASH
jgi:hypothetical protein